MHLRLPSRLTCGFALVSMLVFGLALSSATARSVWSKVGEDGLFPNWRDQIAHMVDDAPKRPANHVCIVGWRADTDADLQQAYVIWPEQHRLVTWMPSTDPNSLSAETHVLDLTKDVVANERLVNGSTYLVSRAWVSNIERECRKFGTTLLFRSARDGNHG